MYFKQEEAISSLRSNTQKLVDHFPFLGSNISTTENDGNIVLEKIWTGVFRLLIIWRVDLSDALKKNYFQAVAVWKVLYGCTKWTITKHVEPKTAVFPSLIKILNKYNKTCRM